ncbi:hypothetical protein [Streptomyces sp. NPDC087294]|uniref:SCO2400 family protein n=1 Tax=Streptomyces sp. NPDC087294 TaxID=3365777 RepID=UPI0038143993
MAPGTAAASYDGDHPAPSTGHDSAAYEVTPHAAPETAVFSPSGDVFSDDVVDAPVASQGRAARRRQLARWKKNKRRAAVATAVALVGGGLSVAAMNRGAADRAQATAAPDPRGMGGVQEQAADVTDPTSTPSAARKSSRVVTTPKRTPSANAPHEQSADSPRTTLKLVPSGTPTTPTPASTPGGAQQRSAVSPATEKTENTENTEDTAAVSPTPTAPDDANSASSEPSSTPTPSETADDPSSSSAKLCLLVICLG